MTTRQLETPVTAPTHALASTGATSAANVGIMPLGSFRSALEIPALTIPDMQVPLGTAVREPGYVNLAHLYTGVAGDVGGALNAAFGDGFRNILIPKGVRECLTSAAPPAGTFVFGEGEQTVLRMHSSMHTTANGIFYIDADNITLEGMQLDGDFDVEEYDHTESRAVGIWMNGGKHNFTMDHLFVHHFPRRGVSAISSGLKANFRAINCEGWDFMREFILLVNSVDAKLIGCTSRRTGDDAFALNTGLTTGGIVSACVMEDVGYYNYVLDGLLAGGSGVKLHGNNCIVTGCIGRRLVQGLVTTKVANLGGPEPHSIKVIGNVLEGLFPHFTGGSQAGIDIEDGTNITIENNHLDVSNGTAAAGIMLRHPSNRCRNNDIVNARYAYHLIGHNGPGNFEMEGGSLEARRAIHISNFSSDTPTTIVRAKGLRHRGIEYNSTAADHFCHLEAGTQAFALLEFEDCHTDVTFMQANSHAVGQVILDRVTGASGTPWPTILNGTNITDLLRKVNQRRAAAHYTANATLTAADLDGRTLTNTGATGTVVLTLPAAQIGLKWSMRRVANQAFRIRGNQAASEIVGTGGGGKYLQLGVVGDFIRAECFVLGVWTLTTEIGTITYEP